MTQQDDRERQTHRDRQTESDDSNERGGGGGEEEEEEEEEGAEEEEGEFKAKVDRGRGSIRSKGSMEGSEAVPDAVAAGLELLLLLLCLRPSAVCLHRRRWCHTAADAEN